MYRSIKFVISLLALSLAGIACHHEPIVTSEIKTDSLVTIKLPDFTAVVTNSVTPTGKLDQILFLNTFRYNVNEPFRTDSIRTKLFYDSLGRVVGNLYINKQPLMLNETERDQEIRLAQSAALYEYKDNRLFRVFGKVANYEMPSPVYYDVNEFVYESAPYPTFRLNYYVEPTGKVKLMSRYRMVYDANGNLLEEADINKSSVYERYKYQDGNINYLENIDPTGALFNYHQEYVYDTKPNPSKGLFWNSGNRPNYINLSKNNVIRITTVQDNPTSSSTSVVLNNYDTQDRLIRQTILFGNSSTTNGSQVWHYRYGK